MDDADLLAARWALQVQNPEVKKFTRRMAINIADFYDVSPRYVVQRLEALGALKKGSWDWFVSNGGITRALIAEVRADRAAGRHQ